MGDFATLRFGPKNASRRVVFGHGVGGLDKSEAVFDYRPQVFQQGGMRRGG